GVPQMLTEVQSSYEQARRALDAGDNDKTSTLVQAALVTCSRIQERLPDSPEAKKADEWAAKLKPLARSADNAAKVARIEDQAQRRLAVIRNLARERETASLERNSDTVETLTVLLRQNIDKLIKEYPHTKAAKEAKDLRP
ncbi:MAG TPA: hypothetical protein VFA18_15685, partial [Gemmataceae bacterium]|nr:hypothetical protein [Gemmataceae bacterium]